MSDTYTTGWETYSVQEVWVQGHVESVWTLDAVNGELPVRAMLEILDQDQAWTKAEEGPGRVYERTLEQGVAMKIHVSELGQVNLTQFVPGEGAQVGVDEDAVRARQRGVLAAAAAQAQEIRGKLIANTMVRSLELAQREMKLTCVGTHVIENQCNHFIYESTLQIELTV